MEEVVYYGALCLIPTVVLFTLAITTKRLLETMFIASVTAFIVIDRLHFVGGWLDALYTVMANDVFIWVILTVGLFGGFASLLERSGGALGFGQIASKYVKTKKGSLIATYVMGLLIFIDDFLNALAVGAAMRNLTDQKKVPREALAFAVNTSGCPVCILVPFSTWAVFMTGLIDLQGISYNGTAAGAYLKSIPFMVYAMVALVIGALFVIGVMPKIGPMKKAFQRAEDGKVFPEGSEPMTDEMEISINKCKAIGKPNIINFLIPMAVLIGVTLAVGNDLVIGCLAAIVVSFIMYIPRKVMSIDDFTDAFVDGIKGMLFVFILILLLFILLEANIEMGFTEYIISKVQPLMKANWLPAISFLVVGAIAFFIGTFWELAAISIPIILPMALTLGVNPFLTLGAVISGTIFGCHACFFSDVFIVVAKSAQIKPMDQFRTGLPYTLISGGIAFLIFIVLGYIV